MRFVIRRPLEDNLWRKKGKVVPGCEADQRTSPEPEALRHAGRCVPQPGLIPTVARLHPQLSGAGRIMSAHGLSGSGRPRSCGLTPWLTVTFSVLGSAVAVVAVGSLCALMYPILRGIFISPVTLSELR